MPIDPAAQPAVYTCTRNVSDRMSLAERSRDASLGRLIGGKGDHDVGVSIDESGDALVELRQHLDRETFGDERGCAFRRTHGASHRKAARTSQAQHPRTGVA